MSEVGQITRGTPLPTVLLGSWSYDGLLYPTVWGKGGATKGSWAFSLDRTGLHMFGDLHEDREDGSSFDGHGVLVAEPGSTDLLWFFFDSFGFPPTEPARGTWDGRRLVLEKVTPRGRGRNTFELEEKGMTHLVEFSPPGAGEFQAVARSICRRS